MPPTKTAATIETTDGPPRALRADARRNRERLLAAAEKAFAATGTDASLDDIARQAGVGIGTLYRHFPTRDDLIEALIDGEARQLLVQGEELTEADDPFDALRSWLHAVIHHAARFRGLAQSLVVAECGDSRLGASCRAKAAVTTQLFERAQQAGALRSDVTVDELHDLVSAIAWASEQRTDSKPDRLLAIALDGLRPVRRSGRGQR